MSPKFQDPLPLLAGSGLRFIIIGGVAASAHGAPRATHDIDIVYGRDPDNIQRPVDLLQPHKPYLRGAPRDCPSAGTRAPSKPD